MNRVIALILVLFSTQVIADRYVRNTTGSTLTLFGHDIPSTGYFLIPDQEYRGFGSSQDFIDAITNGDIVVASSDSGSEDILSVQDALLFYESFVLPEETWFSWPTFTSKNVRDAIVEARDSAIGHIYTNCFHRQGAVKDKWLSNAGDNLTSDSEAMPLPWDSTLVAMTYTSKEDRSDTDIEVRAAPLGSGNVDVLKYTWQIRGSRTSAKNDISVSFNGADKVGVFAKDQGEDAKDVVVCLYFKVRTSTTIDSDEEWDNNL